jgi:hypothetical protein
LQCTEKQEKPFFQQSSAIRNLICRVFRKEMKHATEMTDFIEKRGFAEASAQIN